MERWNDTEIRSNRAQGRLKSHFRFQSCEDLISWLLHRTPTIPYQHSQSQPPNADGGLCDFAIYTISENPQALYLSPSGLIPSFSPILLRFLPSFELHHCHACLSPLVASRPHVSSHFNPSHSLQTRLAQSKLSNSYAQGHLTRK